VKIEQDHEAPDSVRTIKADGQRTCQDSGGNTSKPQGYMDQRFSREATARWSRIGNSGIVGESELPAQSCALGAATYSENDDKAFGRELCWHECRAWRWPLSSSGGLPHYVCEGPRESSTTWHGYATACQESIHPKAMWAPALVPPPLIGRHRSRCSWDVPVTPSNGVSPNARNASVNGDQPY
jgi:hypothetical protein